MPLTFEPISVLNFSKFVARSLILFWQSHPMLLFVQSFNISYILEGGNKLTIVLHQK